MSQTSQFEQIDKALAKYYALFGEDGSGLFTDFINKSEYPPSQWPLETQLGPESHPSQCVYTKIFSSKPVPIPKYVCSNKIEEFGFYVLQYCYKHFQPPPKECMLIYFPLIWALSNMNLYIISRY